MRKRYSIWVSGLLLAVSLWPLSGSACGGFFCQTLPIDQAGEQIVFRQDGDQITAMVQIQFVGEASDFGWVVPVPSTPTFELGSNQVFSQLELATRPQFNLTRTGQECEAEFVAFPTDAGTDASTADSADTDDGVTVESVEEVGSYIVTVISGTDPQAVALWLSERNFDLSERGAELLAPYIEDEMKFVAVELQSGRVAGDIQPLILKYQSDKPEVPIRLTAVAAVEDMGVLVWVVGDARAVPENYLHVTPNYTRLNWYTGFSGNAYSSYQTLITDAMDEAGGQGFATDYAGRFENLASRLPTSSDFTSLLNQFSALSDAEFISSVIQSFFSPSITSTISRLLPLANNQTIDVYFDPFSLSVTYTGAQLSAARAELDQFIRTDIIDAIDNSVDLLDDDRYLTRLFTTLSSSEMTLDPEFVFNSDMAGQPLARNATLDANCINDQTEWTLTLGAGTGRDDVVVIDAVGAVPSFSAPAISQEASWRIEETSDSGQPIVMNERTFQVASLNAGQEIGTSGDIGSGPDTNTGTDPSGGSVVSTGGGGTMGFGALFIALLAYRRRLTFDV